MDNISRQQSEVAIALTLGVAAGGLLAKIILNNVIRGEERNSLTVLESEDTLTKILMFTSTFMLGMLLQSSNPYDLSLAFFGMGVITVIAVTRYNKEVMINAANNRFVRES